MELNVRSMPDSVRTSTSLSEDCVWLYTKEQFEEFLSKHREDAKCDSEQCIVGE